MSHLAVRSLRVTAGGRNLLDGVDLDVAPGEWCTVIGPNGAGKTMLVEAVAGLRRVAAGTISVGEVRVDTLGERARARLVALVPQHPVVPAGMSVRDYVALGRISFHGVLRPPSRADHLAVDEALDKLALGDLVARDVASLSGGERQRAVIARALAQTTPIVVLDEPTNGLDVRHQLDLLELVRARVHDDGLTVVATLHDLTLAGQFADRLVLLAGGRVVLDGPSREVVRDAALGEAYEMSLRIVDVDGRDVVVPVRSSLTPR